VCAIIGACLTVLAAVTLPVFAAPVAALELTGFLLAHRRTRRRAFAIAAVITGIALITSLVIDLVLLAAGTSITAKVA
jgi:hypothetical protein